MQVPNALNYWWRRAVGAEDCLGDIVSIMEEADNYLTHLSPSLMTVYLLAKEGLEHDLEVVEAE